MWTMDLDIPITRRQRLHTVRDGDGNLKFTSGNASAAFEFLWSQGKKECEIIIRLPDEVIKGKFAKFLPLAPDWIRK